MKRLGLAMILMIAASTATAGTFVTSFDAAVKQAKEKKQLIFIDMFAEWCGWCHRMEREVFPSQDFQNVSKNMVLLRLNTEDRKEGTLMAQRYGVRSLPTFVLLDSDLLVAGIIQGYSPAPDFVMRLKQAVEKFGTFQKKLSEEPAYRANHLKRLAVAEELNARMGFPQAETRLNRLLTEKNLTAGSRESAYMLLAASQRGQKKHDAAIKTLQKLKAPKTTPSTREQAFLTIGEIYLEQKNYKAALDEFKSFKQSFPKSSHMQNVDYLVPQLENAVAGKN